MSNQVIYIVTHYGCNSTPSDMWIPVSKMFVSYDEAYKYFLTVSPSLDDKYNKAEQVININYEEKGKKLTQDYIIIENRMQIAGYHCGDGYCAKRPYGAVIAKSILKFD